MDSLSASTIVVILLGVLVTVFILVVILYKPPRQLKVHSNLKSGNGNNNSVLEVKIENVGKTKEKIIPPYLKFSAGFHSKKYQVAKDFVNCRYPRILKPGEEMTCEIDISHYHKLMEKEDFKPTHLNVLIDDMVGMEFKSEEIDL
jgi:hypothetical protein